MNNNFRCFLRGLFIFTFIFCLFHPMLGADLKLPFSDEAENPPPISMDFQDANLKDVIKLLSIQSGLNFIASEAVKDRKITLYLDKVTLDEAMNKIFKANNLSFELDKESNIFIVRDWGTPRLETVTKIFFLKYATVSSSSLKEEMSKGVGSSSTSVSASTSTSGTSSGSSSGSGKWQVAEDTGLTTAIKKLLSEAGSVIEDFRTNSLIVTDTPNQMAVIEQVIAALDVPVPQVLLEVEMLDVSKNVVDKLGLKWSSTPLSLSITGASASLGFPFQGWSKVFRTTDGSLNINPGTTVGSAYSMQLDFLRTHTDTKFLARPRIMTLNNETAQIRIVTQEAVGLLTTTASSEGQSTSQSGAERSETGVSLRVTPQINTDTGEITMFIVPTVAESTAGNSFTDTNGRSINFRDPEVRSTVSTVRVKDGETVVLGGLIRTEETQTITKMPILSDIPIFGALFRHKDKTKDKERELLVFITPHIINDSGIRLAKTKSPAFPEREQGGFSVYERQNTINTSLAIFERQNR